MTEPEGKPLVCGYQMSDGPCGVPICVQSDSYSGYAHSEGHGWLHWASPIPNRGGSGIFQPCAICGELPDGNKKHFEYGGHKFTTRAKERTCRAI